MYEKSIQPLYAIRIRTIIFGLHIAYSYYIKFLYTFRNNFQNSLQLEIFLKIFLLYDLKEKICLQNKEKTVSKCVIRFYVFLKYSDTILVSQFGSLKQSIEKYQFFLKKPFIIIFNYEKTIQNSNKNDFFLTTLLSNISFIVSNNKNKCYQIIKIQSMSSFFHVSLHSATPAQLKKTTNVVVEQTASNFRTIPMVSVEIYLDIFLIIFNLIQIHSGSLSK